MSSCVMIVRVGNRPRHVGHRVQKRTVHGDGLFEQGIQVGIVATMWDLFVGELRSQRRDDGIQPLWIDQPIKIRQRALADFADGEMFLCLLCLADVFDGSQGPNRGIEKREQVDDKHIIEKEFTIAMLAILPEATQMFVEHSDILGAD